MANESSELLFLFLAAMRASQMYSVMQYSYSVLQWRVFCHECLFTGSDV